MKEAFEGQDEKVLTQAHATIKSFVSKLRELTELEGKCGGRGDFI